MSTSGNRAGSPHGFQESFLIVARLFTWQLHFYVKSFAVRTTVPPYIGLTVVPYVHDATVLGVKLTDSVVSCHTAVLA
jgi:hypothetical protein